MTNNRVLLLSFISIAILVGQAAISNRGYAQETKTFTAPGVYEIGGNLSYKYSSYVLSGSTLSTNNYISFLSYIGYFITDNIELGLNPIGITSTWNSAIKNTSYSIFLAPAYNFKTEGSVYPFVEAQLGYTNEITSSSYGSSDYVDYVRWV